MQNSITSIRSSAATAISSDPTRAQILKDLKKWVEAPGQGKKEYRSIAYDKIIECFNDSSKKRLILRGLGLTVAPPHFPPNVEVVDLSGNHLGECATPRSRYLKDVILTGNPIGLRVVTPNPTYVAELVSKNPVNTRTRPKSISVQPSKISEGASHQGSRTPAAQSEPRARSGSFLIGAAGPDDTRPRAEEGPKNRLHAHAMRERENHAPASEGHPQAAGENADMSAGARILKQIRKNRGPVSEPRPQMATGKVVNPAVRRVFNGDDLPVRKGNRGLASERRPQMVTGNAVMSAGAQLLKQTRNRQSGERFPIMSGKPQGLGERSKTFFVRLDGPGDTRQKAK